jgi:hypothetical protein
MSSISAGSVPTSPNILVKCFPGQTDQKTKLCIRTTSEYDEHSTCSAHLGGKECNSCAYYTDFHCLDSDTGVFLDGFQVDCSNVRESASNLKACGQKFREERAQKPLPSSPSISSNSNDGGLMGVIPLVFFVLLAISVRTLRGNRSSAKRRGGGEDDEAMEMVSMMFSEQQQSPAAVAKEELQDGNFTFEYFNAAETDVIGSALTAFSMNNDWEKVKQTMERTNKAGTCAEERSFYMKTVAQNISKAWPENLENDTVFSPLLDSWKRSEPDNADCRIIRAEAYISWAWHARSAAVAPQVSCQQFGLFITRLRMCVLELAAARRLRPEDPLIYSTGISLMMGLGRWDDSVMTVEDCLSSLRGVAQEPQFYYAHVDALQYYCGKWHGSHEQMFAYARSVTSDLPVGHPLWVLIPMAHFERQLIDRPQNYWKRPQVVTEIENAYRNAFPGQAETSIQAPRTSAKRMEWVCRNYFAYTLAMCNLQELARRQIRLIGRRPIEGNPWGSLTGYKKLLRDLGFEFDCPSHFPDVIADFV